MHSGIKKLNSEGELPGLAQEVLHEKLCSVQEWILGPGERLLSSQRFKPYSYKEAVDMRKEHEQIEFKCMKALENFASVYEYRKHNISNTTLDVVERLVQNYIDRLNRRTFFVVTCHSYFRSVEELWRLLEEVHKRSQEVDMGDSVSTRNAIDDIESGLEKSDSRLNVLAHELERLKVILTSSDPTYLAHLEECYEEVFKTAGERIQDMKIRRLVLKKHSKLLECEQNVHESVGWIEELFENVDLLYRENCVGKNQLEASALHNKCSDIYKQAKTTYTYSTQIVETYAKLCEADGRKLPRNVSLSCARLNRMWPRLEDRIREFQDRTAAAESMYTHVDLLLSRVQKYLLEASSDPPDVDRVSQVPTGMVARVTPNSLLQGKLNDLTHQFQEVKSLGLKLIIRLPKGLLTEDPHFVGTIGEEVTYLIRLKLYTLWLKLRDLECTVLEHGATDNGLAAELGLEYRSLLDPFYGCSDLFTGSKQSDLMKTESLPLMRARSSPSSPRRFSQAASEQSPKEELRSLKRDFFPPLRVSVPPSLGVSVPTSCHSEKYDETTEPIRRIKNAFEQFRARFSKIVADSTLHVGDAKVESTKRAIELELQQLESCLADSLAGANDQNSAVFTDFAELILKKAKRLFEQWLRRWDRSGAQVIADRDPRQHKLRQLESDLCECQNRLLDLVNMVCLTMAQGARSVAMSETPDGQQPHNVSHEVVSAQDIELILTAAEETRGMVQTVPDQEQFIERTFLGLEFVPHLKWKVLSVRSLWQTYQERLDCFEKFITSLEHGFKLLSLIEQFTARKDAYFGNPEAHQAELSELQTEGHRLEQQILQLVDPDRLHPLAERVGSLLEATPRVGWLVLRLRTSLTEIKDITDEADMLFCNLRTCGLIEKMTPKRSQARNLNGTLGITREPSSQPHRASAVPRIEVSSTTKINSSERLEDIQDLVISEPVPPPLPPRTTTVPLQTALGASGLSRRVGSSQDSNRSEVKSFDSTSLSTPSTWRITHPFGNVSVNAGDNLSLVCQFTGPSDLKSFSTKWLFRPLVYVPGEEVALGQEFDILPTDNSVSQESGLDYTRLLLTSIVPKQAGMYSVRIVPSTTGRELTCSSIVHVLPQILSPMVDLTVAPADALTDRLEPVAFTVTYRGFTNTPHAMWTFSGQPIDPAIWRTITTGNSSTISSNVAERSSQGHYECSLRDLQTGFELRSSATLSVGDHFRFTETLQPLCVKSGQPFKLSCRINHSMGTCRSISGEFGDSEGTPESHIHWFLNEHELTALELERLGITTQLEGDILELNVSDANSQHAGLYQCEVKAGNNTARTHCTVAVQENVAPKVLVFSVEPPGPIIEGQTVSMSVWFEANPLPSYSWKKDGEILLVKEERWKGCKHTICADCCTLTIPHVRQEHSGVYQISLSNCAGMDEANVALSLTASGTTKSKNVSARTDVHTWDPISDLTDLIILHPKSVLACAGERLRFVCIVDTSYGPASVEWSHEGRRLSSQAEFRIFNNHPREGIFHLELESVGRRNAGDYCANAMRVDAKLGTKSVERSQFELKFHESPNLEVPPVAPYCSEEIVHSILRVVLGEEVTLSFSVNAYPEPEFCWIRNKKDLVVPSCEKYEITREGTFYYLTIESVSLEDSGLWELVCYNSAGVLVSSNYLEVISPVSDRMTESCSRTVAINSTNSTVLLPDSPPTPADAATSLVFSPSTSTLSERKAIVSNPINVDNGVTQPPEFKTVFTDLTCRTGDTVRLRASLTGSPSPLVSWSFNGEPIQNSDDRCKVVHHDGVYSLLIESVRITDSGRYSLTAENIVGLATCSALLFVSTASNVRTYSPLSDPGYSIQSADGFVNGSVFPTERRLRQHSGTQTPAHQRVALIRSISTSHLDDELLEPKHAYINYVQCPRCSRRKRYVCGGQSLEASRIKSAGSNFTGKRHRGAHGRIQGRCVGLHGSGSPWRFLRHDSEGSLVHICPSCHSVMESRLSYEDGDSDDDLILSTHITERVYTCERNRNEDHDLSYTHTHMGRGQTEGNLFDHPRCHRPSTHSRPTDQSRAQREIPIHVISKKMSSNIQEQPNRRTLANERVTPVVATRTSNLPLSGNASAPLDPQFSTVESSDEEMNH